MGVCPQQHRISTGRYNSIYFRECMFVNKSKDDMSIGRALRISISVVGLICYMYVICLLMALFIETTLNQTLISRIHPTVKLNSLRELTNIGIFIIIYSSLPKFAAHNKFSLRKRIISHFRVFNNNITQYTLWIFALNLSLIVIYHPTIVNPGPPQKKSKVSVAYHNVQGFVPLNDLGNPNPMLHTDKLLEFQSYLAHKKPDVVILNETWLSDNVNDSEIFPNHNYKVFRLDRSHKTHPIDPNDPDKFKKNGGGVIIAIKTELKCESNIIKLNCKAEILSVEIGLGNGKCICLCTLYRVGTLGAENHRVVDSYLRNLSKRKKYSKIILIGDLNLNKVSWPENSSTSNIQEKFLDTFNDLNFDQLINKPTHYKGNILDVILTNAPQIISDIDVKRRYEICTSDHFGIEFTLDINISRKKTSEKKNI